MTATQDATIAELQRTNAKLRREREAGLAREATLAEELAARDAALAQRNTQYSERIEHQAATVDVLKADVSLARRSAACVRPDSTTGCEAVQCADGCGRHVRVRW